MAKEVKVAAKMFEPLNLTDNRDKFVDYLSTSPIMGQLADAICNRTLEFDITLPELQSLFADFELPAPSFSVQ